MIWTTGSFYFYPVSPRGAYLAVHPRSKTKSLPLAGVQLLKCIFRFGNAFSTPSTQHVYFYSLLLFFRTFRVCFLAIWEVRNACVGGKKWRHRLCWNFVREALPNDKTRDDLVMCPFVHSNFSCSDLALSLSLSLEAAQTAPNPDVLTHFNQQPNDF